jgi:excisionase family DNA binding protein
MVKPDRDLSPWELARLFRCSRWMIRRWIDSGELKGYRAGLRRRVDLADALAFARDRGMAAATRKLERLASAADVSYTLFPTALIVSFDSEIQGAFDRRGWDTAWASDWFRVGSLATTRTFSAAVLDCHLGRAEVAAYAQVLRLHCPSTLLAVLCAEDEPSPADWRPGGYAAVWHRPENYDRAADELWAKLVANRSAARRPVPSA